MKIEDLLAKAISVDLKITDYCSYGCSFCYQNSKTSGKHADLNYVKKVLDLLNEHDILEVVVGGGEPTQYPYISDVFLEVINRRMFFAITTKNYNFAKDIFTLKFLERLRKEVRRNKKKYMAYFDVDTSIPQFVINVGFSPTPQREFNDLKRFRDSVVSFFKETFSYYIDSIDTPNTDKDSFFFDLEFLERQTFDLKIRAKIHLIEGIHFKTEKEIQKILNMVEKLYYSIKENYSEYFKSLDVLLLGYKQFGRGKNFKVESKIKEIAEYLKSINFVYDTKYESKPILISVDSVLVNKLKEHIDIYEESVVKDGKRTFFIDAVNKKFAENSFTEELFDLMI